VKQAFAASKTHLDVSHGAVRATLNQECRSAAVFLKANTSDSLESTLCTLVHVAVIGDHTAVIWDRIGLQILLGQHQMVVHEETTQQSSAEHRIEERRQLLRIVQDQS
jgi:hypothetical protein